jgi:hypothetical protein
VDFCHDLLRAEAFVRDWSINEVVLDAIRAVVDGDRPEVLEQVLSHARSAGKVPGRGAQRRSRCREGAPVAAPFGEWPDVGGSSRPAADRFLDFRSAGVDWVD